MEETALPPIALGLDDWNEVKRIIRQYLPKNTVWAFGSRVTGTYKTYSDLDLAILTEQPLSLEQVATIKDAFAESDMTIRVDLVDWAATSEAFRKIIQQQHLVLWDADNQE